MSNSLAVWVVVLIALLLANLPFVSDRVLVFWPLQKTKSLLIRLIELGVFYFLVGGAALALEHHAGQITPQKWEFYAITVTLFATFAFPGFVYRYLLKK